MGQNLETWMVLAALAVCVVAILLWIKDAGDDWLCASDCTWDTQRSSVGNTGQGLAPHERPAGQHAGAR